jgi:hypothetical protein
MHGESSSVELLRSAAALHGVEPSDADLEAVLALLAAILPELAEIERELPPDAPP